MQYKSQPTHGAVKQKVGCSVQTVIGGILHEHWQKGLRSDKLITLKWPCSLKHTLYSPLISRPRGVTTLSGSTQLAITSLCALSWLLLDFHIEVSNGKLRSSFTWPRLPRPGLPFPGWCSTGIVFSSSNWLYFSPSSCLLFLAFLCFLIFI